MANKSTSHLMMAWVSPRSRFTRPTTENCSSCRCFPNRLVLYDACEAHKATSSCGAVFWVSFPSTWEEPLDKKKSIKHTSICFRLCFFLFRHGLRPRYLRAWLDTTWGQNDTCPRWQLSARAIRIDFLCHIYPPLPTLAVVDSNLNYGYVSDSMKVVQKQIKKNVSHHPVYWFTDLKRSTTTCHENNNHLSRVVTWLSSRPTSIPRP